jgi:ankyrin repeat protein
MQAWGERYDGMERALRGVNATSALPDPPPSPSPPLSPSGGAVEPTAQALMQAVTKGDVERVRGMLAHAPDPTALLTPSGEGGHGTAPLIEAVARGFLPVVELLLTHRADPNARGRGGRTPLIAAAGDGHEEVLQLLLERGADPNLQDEKVGQLDGQTGQADYTGSVFAAVPAHVLYVAPSHSVCRNSGERNNSVTCWVQADSQRHGGRLRGTVPGSPRRSHSLMPLGANARAAETCRIAVGDIQLRIAAKGGDSNPKGPLTLQGETPLFTAAAMGRRPVVAKLLAHGADPRYVTRRN